MHLVQNDIVISNVIHCGESKDLLFFSVLNHARVLYQSVEDSTTKLKQNRSNFNFILPIHCNSSDQNERNGL